MNRFNFSCFYAFLVALALNSHTAHAQTNTAQSNNPAASGSAATNDEMAVAVREYLKLTNEQAQFPILLKFMNDSVLAATRASLDQSLKAKPMEAKRQADANAVLIKNFDEFREATNKTLSAKFPWSRMVDEIYVPAYRKQFTVAEIKVANEFYRSAVGKKMVETKPQIVVEASKAMSEKYSPLLNKEFSPSSDELVIKIRAEFEKLEK
jgi:hypothetical protein